MKYLLKGSSVALVGFLALVVLAPAALAHKKIIVRNIYEPAPDTVYVTPKTTPDLGIVTLNTIPSGDQVYVNGNLVGETGTTVHTMALGPGSYTIEERDAKGKVIWTEPGVTVVRHHTTIIYPQ